MDGHSHPTQQRPDVPGLGLRLPLLPWVYFSGFGIAVMPGSVLEAALQETHLITKAPPQISLTLYVCLAS